MEKKTQNFVPNVISAEELVALAKNEVSPAKEQIKALFDEGTFAQIGTYAHKVAAELGSEEAELEGVICGYGAINGRLVFSFVQDFSRMKGAVGEAHAKKICSLYELAIKNGAPVIAVFNSAGAKLTEGVEALAGYGKIMKKVSAASGVIPQIAIISGICGGAAATIACMFDILVGVQDGGSLYVNPPFITNEFEGGKELGSIASAAANGLVNVCVNTSAEALSYTRMLLSYIPQNNNDGTAYSSTTDEINRLTPAVSSVIAKSGYSMTDVIGAISDDANLLELSKDYAKSMITGFITLNGMVIGVVANQPSINGGKLTSDAALKAARFINFCDAFKIPILTLVDTEGYEATAEAEKSGYATALAKLASAYATAECAMVTVVLGKAYGTAFTLMGSKSIGADIALASETAKISAMPTSSAVAFLWNDKIEDNSKRSEVEAEWDKVMASPVIAAKAGEIDDIISLDELRQRTAAAFEMLGAKNMLTVPKRHNNLPL